MRNARLATFEQHTLRRGMRSRGWRGRLGRPHNSSRPSSDAFGSARLQFGHKGWLGIAQSVVTGSQDPYAFCWGRCKRRSVSCAPTMQEFCSCEATNCNGTRQDTYPGPYGICFLSPPTRMPTPSSSRSRSRCRRQLSKSGERPVAINPWRQPLAPRARTPVEPEAASTTTLPYQAESPSKLNRKLPRPAVAASPTSPSLGSVKGGTGVPPGANIHRGRNCGRRRTEDKIKYRYL